MKVRGKTCSRQRCKYPPRYHGLCKKHAVDEADRLFSLSIRAINECEIDDGKPHTGNLQCCHIFSRSYHAIRWDPRNAVSGCQGHHTFYTHHPEEWDIWRRDWLGEETFTELRELLLTHRWPDLEVVLTELRGLVG